MDPADTAGTLGVPAEDRPVGLPQVREPAWASDVVAELLAARGARYLPLTPGSSFRGLHDSVVNHLGNRQPQVVLCAHEAVAVAVAHAYAKATLAPAPVVLHDLVGLMNAQMAVYNAWCDRAPVLVLGGGGPSDPRERRPIDWVHSATAQAELVRPFVRFDAEPTELPELLAAIDAAWTATSSGGGGPAYVTLDVALQERALPQAGRPRLPEQRPDPPPTVPDRGAAEAAARLLAGARSPVLLAGRTGLDAATTPALVELAELLGAAAVDERNFVSFPTDHSLNLTGERTAVRDADVVVAVDPHDLRAALASRAVGDPASIAVPTIVSLAPGELDAPSWSNFRRDQPRPDVALVGDVRSSLEALLAAIATHGPGPRDERAAAVAERRAELRLAQERVVQERWDATPISGARLVAEVWQAVRERPWLLTVRNTRSWPEGVWRFDGGGRYLGHSGGGGVGYGPGALVGGGLAARDRGEFPVAIIGDGDLLMAPAALWTAVHHRIPTLVVVNDNRSFGNDETHQERVAVRRGRPTANAVIGTRFDDPDVDVPQMARAFGAWAEGPVTEPARLAAALRRAVAVVADGGVAVVDVITGDR